MYDILKKKLFHFVASMCIHSDWLNESLTNTLNVMLDCFIALNCSFQSKQNWWKISQIGPPYSEHQICFHSLIWSTKKQFVRRWNDFIVGKNWNKSNANNTPSQTFFFSSVESNIWFINGIICITFQFAMIRLKICRIYWSRALWC